MDNQIPPEKIKITHVSISEIILAVGIVSLCQFLAYLAFLH